MDRQPSAPVERGPFPADLTVAGYARRADVHLRARYPLLSTSIYEVEPAHHVIVLDDPSALTAELQKEFSDSIRPVAWRIELADVVPGSPARQLTPLSDAEAAGGFAGLGLSVRDLVSLILSRFPTLPIVGLADVSPDWHLVVKMSAPISREDEQSILAFLRDLELPLKPAIEVVEGATPMRVRDGMDRSLEGLPIVPARRRPNAPPFVRKDEALWFEQLPAAASGARTGLDVFGGEEDVSRCYVDFTTGRHVNLRQLLLLYDEVCCSLPLFEGHDAFLADQALTNEDLLDLAARGRLKFISTQPEERVRLDVLAAAAERAPGAIIGRRQAALVLLADLCFTAQRYRLADERLKPGLTLAANRLGELLKLPTPTVERLMLWPVSARRECLPALLAGGTKSAPAISIGLAVSEFVAQIAKVDVQLEAMVLSERVHVAHALNATAIPALDEPRGFSLLMDALGHELNFYRHFNTAIAARWAANERRRQTGVDVLPPIPLLDFERAVPLSEILEAGTPASTREKGRALLSRLAGLPADAREAEIERLAAALRRMSKRRDRLLTLDHTDTAISLASLMANLTWPGLVGPARLGRQVAEELRRFPAVDRFIADLEADFAGSRGVNQDLDFLNRISRVARLKVERV